MPVKPRNPQQQSDTSARKKIGQEKSTMRRVISSIRSPARIHTAGHVSGIPTEIMSFTDQGKHVLSDIVTAFSLAIVGVCRALEQQQKIMPEPIAEAIHTEMGQLPTGSSGQTVTVKDILANIAKGLKGEPIAKVRFP